MHKRKQGCTAEIKVKAEGLINRQLNGGRFGAAAKRQHHGKTGETDDKYNGEHPGQHATQHRIFQQMAHVARAEPQAGSKPEPLGRDRQPTLQDQPHRQWQVEKHMRQQHPVQPIDLHRVKSNPAQRDAENAFAAKHRQQTQHRHDHRQDKRRSHQRQQY